jgi:Family of unknown function (DUF6459)
MTECSRRTNSSGAIPIARGLRWASVDDREPTRGPQYTQGALALTFALPTGLDTDPRSDALSVVSDVRGADYPTPDPQPWAARFLQAVVEVVANERPLTQLTRWTDSAVFAEIADRRQRVADRRAGARSRPGRQVVATVHICRPEHDVAEVAARVTAGSRSRAVAARLDYSRGRWLCTAIDFG